MLEELRNRVFMLKCHRYGIPFGKGKGIDQLPDIESYALSVGMPHTLSRDELRRCFLAITELYLQEVARHDSLLAEKISVPLLSMQQEVRFS